MHRMNMLSAAALHGLHLCPIVASRLRQPRWSNDYVTVN
jgi:hypothetical protein